MKKELYSKVEQENFDLIYSLIETTISTQEDNLKGTTVYGIEIKEMSNLSIQDSKLIPDISNDKENIYEFLKILTKCKVRPFILKEVVIDWIE